MTLRPDLLPLLLALTLAAFACRASGFWLMRFVTVTPRMQAALDAAPLAVMVGIVAPASSAAAIGAPCHPFAFAFIALTGPRACRRSPSAPA